MNERIFLGYIFGAVALNEVGVYDHNKGKKVYYVEGEHGPETTRNVLEAKIFETEEEINQLRFKNRLMSDGTIIRDSFLYNCFGQSKEKNIMFIKELWIEDNCILPETPFVIKHDIEIDPEYTQYLDPEYKQYLELKKKFEK